MSKGPMRAERFTTTGVIRRGRLKVSNGGQWIDALRTFREGPVTITVQRQHATRSLQSNSYYWGVIVKAISDHTGYTPDETHQALKALHLPKHLAFADGNGEVVGELVIGGSTRTLNQVEFSDYLNRVREWCRETLDIEIPDAESL